MVVLPLNSHNRVLTLFSCRRFLRAPLGQQGLAIGEENQGWSQGVSRHLL
jgi:hypothetical protein